MVSVVSAKVWLDLGEGVAFCHGKADLLRAIEVHGSVARGAEAVGMSYKRAWQYIRQLENRLGKPILETVIGGLGGGGSRLTETAYALLRDYEEAKKRLHATWAQMLPTQGTIF